MTTCPDGGDGRRPNILEKICKAFLEETLLRREDTYVWNSFTQHRWGCFLPSKGIADTDAYKDDETSNSLPHAEEVLTAAATSGPRSDMSTVNVQAGSCPE